MRQALVHTTSNAHVLEKLRHQVLELTSPDASKGTQKIMVVSSFLQLPSQTRNPTAFTWVSASLISFVSPIQAGT